MGNEGWCCHNRCTEYVGHWGGYVDNECTQCGRIACSRHSVWVNGVQHCSECAGRLVTVDDSVATIGDSRW